MPGTLCYEILTVIIFSAYDFSSNSEDFNLEAGSVSPKFKITKNHAILTVPEASFKRKGNCNEKCNTCKLFLHNIKSIFVF